MWLSRRYVVWKWLEESWTWSIKGRTSPQHMASNLTNSAASSHIPHDENSNSAFMWHDLIKSCYFNFLDLHLQHGRLHDVKYFKAFLTEQPQIWQCLPKSECELQGDSTERGSWSVRVYTMHSAMIAFHFKYNSHISICVLFKSFHKTIKRWRDVGHPQLWFICKFSLTHTPLFYIYICI